MYLKNYRNVNNLVGNEILVFFLKVLFYSKQKLF